MNEPTAELENGVPDEHLSPESKVGLFVLAGLGVLMTSILMLGDIHFRPRNTVIILFNNVEGISDKSPVKISGVEVGNVKKIELADGTQARVTVTLRRDIKLYKTATARIRSTGIIGSKFLALDPGMPDPGMSESDQRLKSGDTITGQDQLDLEALVEHMAKSFDQITGNGKLGENLNATMANLRSITDSLNAAVGQQRESLVRIVKNIEDFSEHAKTLTAHLDEIVAKSKEDVEVALHKLRDSLDRMDDILIKVQNGEGVAGAFISNPKAGEDFKQTVANLKDTTESAKEVLARFSKVRAFWEFQARRDFKAGDYRGDVGLRIEPRPNHFYEILAQNLYTKGSTQVTPGDYERTNTLTGLIGRHWGPLTGAVGVIQSRGGVEGRYRPFQDTEVPVLNRLELIGQAFDFGRDAVLKGRHFTSPNYTAGARFRINPWVATGIQVEDIAEVSHLTGVVHVEFEDKDVAYLLGFVSFAH